MRSQVDEEDRPTLRDEIEAGDHLIVILALHRVVDGGGSAPLVFHRSGFKRLSADWHQCVVCAMHIR